MKAFIWDRHFTTGLETVDQQHRSLVDLVNRLGESLIDGQANGSEPVEAIFKQLADYAAYHFKEEENLMAEAGVDSRLFDQHTRIHRRFLDQLSRMWMSRESMAAPAQILHGFLASWVSFHILGADQAIARQIALIRAGESPARAYEKDQTPQDSGTHALLVAMGNLYGVLSEQNHNLTAANVLLEQRVLKRTEELAEINRALTEANRQLEVISRTDGLLGIANRKHFDERLEAEWRRASRDAKPLSLLMIDIDYFKWYNDTYGHQAGDACLRSVAQTAAGVLSRPGDLLARYGGEEMVAVLPDTDLKGARAVALDICAKLEELHIPHGASPIADHVTVSIGVASIAANKNSNPDAIIGAADRALYLAKESGRNRVCAG
jgi:diguanylate cyclase (GGDEF)-like protein/hemerythrin-like metal-binding protein